MHIPQIQSQNYSLGFIDGQKKIKSELLEWAKEKDSFSVLYDPDRHYILKELIDKLNSL